LSIKIPVPIQQIDFAFALLTARSLWLQDALSETVNQLEISTIDRQLSSLVPKKSLKSLARKGLRGELLFAVPCILEKSPQLLGYYRLLLGFSQKSFYSHNYGLTSFKNMEAKEIR